MLSAKYYCMGMIHKEYSHNAILLAPDVLDQMNALFKRYGMAQVSIIPVRR